MRVLYVEDDLNDIDFTRRELAKTASYIRLDIAKTLNEAREQLANSKVSYDLVLVDLRLPDGTGLELLNEIREQERSLAVVILTGVGDEETAVTALKSGADDYVTKRNGYLSRLPIILEEALARFQAESTRKTNIINVLYAEHNAADIDLTRHHLSRYATHIHMDAVYTATEAIQRLVQTVNENKPYDVLLLDYHLPAKTGLELLKEINQDHQINVPTVLVTGHGSEEVAVQALRLGVSDYVVKNPGYLFKLPAILENSIYSTIIRNERKKLAESEQRFRLLAENALDIVYRFRLQPNRAYEYISPSVTTITGYTPEEFYADSELSLKLVHPDDRPLLAQIANGEDLNPPLVTRWIHKDGNIIWAEQRNTPVYDANGALIAFEGIARDITIRQQALIDLKAAEKAEREQRQFAEALRDSAALLITTVDLDTVMNTILQGVSLVVPHDAANIMLIENDHARQVYWTGYSPEQIEYLRETSFPISDTLNLHQMFVTGLPVLIPHIDQYPDWVHLPNTEWVKSYVAAPIRSHGQVIGFLSLDSRTAGYYSEAHAQQLQTFADQASIAIEHAQLYEKIQSHAQDLEKRVVERTNELQQSQARYQAIVEDQLDLVCRYLPHGILTYVNPAYCKRFGRSPEELLGTSLFDLLPEEERSKLEQRIASLSPQVPYVSAEVFDITAEGEEIWFLWTEHILFDEAGNFVEYQGVGRDISKRKLAEEQLLQMLDEAMKLNEVRSRYISMAAHDLRNPLAVIQSSISMIRQYSDRLTDERKQVKYDHIDNAIKVMVDMLDDVLVIGQAEAGKLKFEPTSVDVKALCEIIIEEEKQSNNLSQQIEFSSQGDCGTADLDTKLVRHILSNLLSNAIKYSPDDSNISFHLHCDFDQIMFRVQDHGIGIPETDQHRLFETFHRAVNAKNISGTGLGLAIVKQSVELHGGTIICESQENVGTIFTVTLPRNPQLN